MPSGDPCLLAKLILVAGLAGWVADIRAIAVQADGRILIGGDFTQVGGQSRNYMARLDADGSVVADFNPGANGRVFNVARPTEKSWSVGSSTRSAVGDVGVGSSQLSPPFVVDSTDDGVLDVGSLTVTGPHAGDFALEDDLCSDQAVPGGDFCGFSVRYTPSAAGHGPRARRNPVSRP